MTDRRRRTTLGTAHQLVAGRRDKPLSAAQPRRVAPKSCPNALRGSGSGLASRGLHQLMSPVSRVSSEAIHEDNPKRISDGIRTDNREGFNYTIVRRVIDLFAARRRSALAATT